MIRDNAGLSASVCSSVNPHKHSTYFIGLSLESDGIVPVKCLEYLAHRYHWSFSCYYLIIFTGCICGVPSLDCTIWYWTFKLLLVFWTMVLEKTLESPLDCKEIQPVHPKGNQPWKFIGRTDVEADILILWPPDVTSWLIWKDPDAGKDWRQEGKGRAEDEMVRWHHWLDGREFEWAPGVGDGHRSLVCCSHGVAKSRTQLSNWTELFFCYRQFCNNIFLCILRINLVT